MFASDFLFGNSVVKRTKSGTYAPVGPEYFAGASVALYFAKKSHPKCAQIFAPLRQFYLTTNACSKSPVIEIIYVSVDEDEETYEKARDMMPWCSVEYNSELRKNLISRYRVSEEHQIPGMSQKTVSTTLPLLLVIGPHGEQAGRLDLDTPEEVFLQHWDYKYNKWPLHA
ncbi:PDI family protein [Besnoitia besnoiti]|uniref:protein-disulfide reductase n=1 Tax=Besnoitia besnoiti TaxID=94643 RepID=A0A2A9MFZ9_BESBE|nr:PDI family protein [Besnoitia besnoiti]PFH35191.1 PDI family protein [Besnoitia besnoiti]